MVRGLSLLVVAGIFAIGSLTVGQDLLSPDKFDERQQQSDSEQKLEEIKKLAEKLAYYSAGRTFESKPHKERPESAERKKLNSEISVLEERFQATKTADERDQLKQTLETLYSRSFDLYIRDEENRLNELAKRVEVLRSRLENMRALKDKVVKDNLADLDPDDDTQSDQKQFRDTLRQLESLLK